MRKNSEARTSRITLNVTPTLAKKLRALSLIKGKSLTDLVIDALGDELNANAAAIDSVITAKAKFDATVGKFNSQTTIFDFGVVDDTGDGDTSAK